MMCPLTREEYGEDSLMWYVDDPRPLTQRRNWTPSKMNELLEREVFCSKLEVFNDKYFHTKGKIMYVYLKTNFNYILKSSGS